MYGERGWLPFREIAFRSPGLLCNFQAYPATPKRHPQNALIRSILAQRQAAIQFFLNPARRGPRTVPCRPPISPL